MKPQWQLILKHDPEKGLYGDCQRTCVAIILGLDALEVPHFSDNPEATRDSEEWWRKRQERWLAQRGLASFTVAYDGSVSFDQVMKWTSCSSPGVPLILAGVSRLGNNHAVVVLDGAIYCDPSGNGIVGPTRENTWEITAISVGASWEGGRHV